MAKTSLYTKFKVRIENEFLKEIIIENNCCSPEEFERAEKFAKHMATILIKVTDKLPIHTS